MAHITTQAGVVELEVELTEVVEEQEIHLRQILLKEHLVELEVDMVEAALGKNMNTKGLMGDINLTIPAGTQPLEQLRQMGKGISHRDGDRIGDHIIHVHIVIPNKMNKKQIRNLEEYLKARD